MITARGPPFHTGTAATPPATYSLRKLWPIRPDLLKPDATTMTTNPSPQGAATLHCFIKRKAKDASCIPISEESFGGKWIQSRQNSSSAYRRRKDSGNSVCQFWNCRCQGKFNSDYFKEGKLHSVCYARACPKVSEILATKQRHWRVQCGTVIIWYILWWSPVRDVYSD